MGVEAGPETVRCFGRKDVLEGRAWLMTLIALDEAKCEIRMFGWVGG